MEIKEIIIVENFENWQLLDYYYYSIIEFKKRGVFVLQKSVEMKKI